LMRGKEGMGRFPRFFKNTTRTPPRTGLQKPNPYPQV